jgi:hypothetical protein
MREFDGNGSSSAPPITAAELPEQTHEQKQQDAIAEVQRQLMFADHQLEGVQRAHDVRAWDANHTRLQAQIATSIEALEKAQRLEVDAGTLTAWQTRLATLREAAAAAKPPERAALALEAEICAALAAKPPGSAEAGHDRKEVTIKALFQQLDVADSRTLLARIHHCRPEDLLVAAFHEIDPSRQANLLQTLKGAGRREAVAAEPARRAAREAGREAAGDGVLHAGPTSVVGAETAPARGLAATSEASTEAAKDVETPETRLRRILEAGGPDDQVEAELGALFGELDGATRRVLAERFERYRQGSGDDIAARFVRLEPPVRRRLLGALTAPARQPPAAGLRLLTVTAAPGPATHPLLLPDADHPARRDVDGEQVIQAD